MQVYFNPQGNQLAALLLGGMPLVMLGVAWLGPRRWKVRRPPYAPLVVVALLAVFYGWLYVWLFHERFYTLTLQPDRWQLDYRLPARQQNVMVGEITDLGTHSGGLWSPGMAYLWFTTRDGRRYTSAPLSISRSQSILQTLTRARSGPVSDSER